MRIVDADVRLAVAVKRNPTHGHPPGAPTVEAALADAERNGFRLAVIGRTCALVAVASFYLEAFGYPNNVVAAAGILFTAALGLIPLGLVGGRLEARRAVRFVHPRCSLCQRNCSSRTAQ